MRAVNLIPAEQRGDALLGTGRSEGAAYALLALLAGLAILALLYGIAHHQVASRRNQLASLTARAQQDEAAAAGLAPYTSFVALREQRLQAVSQLAGTRFDWAHALHEVGRVIPGGVALSALEGEAGGSSQGASASSAPAVAAGAGTVTSATPAGTVPTFTLSGCAASQPLVALMLERLRLIDDVAGATLQSSTKGSGASGCSPRYPSFTMHVGFQPLPSAPASSAPATPSKANAADTTAGTGAGR
jgi:hypothetical protein